MNSARAKVIFAWLCLAVSSSLAASDITITRASVTTVNGMMMLDAQAELELGDDAIEALNSGIPLFFTLEIKITRQRKYLWDPEIHATERRFSIERHALSEQFIVHDLVTGERRVHDSMAAAIEDLGHVRELPIVDAEEIDASDEQIVGIRLRLDLEALPAPMIPLAYLSPSWHMSSGWYRWKAAR